MKEVTANPRVYAIHNSNKVDDKVGYIVYASYLVRESDYRKYNTIDLFDIRRNVWRLYGEETLGL